MNNVERQKALRDVPGSFIRDVIVQPHLTHLTVKGAILAPYTFVTFEDVTLHRFVLDDGVNEVTCYCRSHTLPKEYTADTLHTIQAILSHTDETSLFCYSFEGIESHA